MNSQAIMTPYPEYKATNLPWLPQIPVHWEISRAKNLYYKAARPVSNNAEVVTCFRDGQVTLRKNRRTSGFTESLKEIGYQGIAKGDLVIHVMDAFAGAVGVSDSDGKGTPVYSVCVAKDKGINNYYYAFIVREMAKRGFIQALYRGIRERSSDFRFEVFAAQSLPVPSAAEQEQIVRYLDSMTAKINKLIRAKKKQIALLQEQKQAIINQAVTKGLNPNAEMKDSGIDWLGQIPVHWTIKNFSKVASIKSNLVKPENYYDYPQVSPDKIEKHTGKLLPVISVKEAGIISNNHLFFKGQILYSKIRPLLNKVTIAPFDGLCSADMYPIETILETEYLKFFMLSTWFLYQIKQSGDRVKMPKINQEEMAKLEIVIPARKEQKDIVCFIYEHWNQFDIVLQSLEKSIQTLSEYKNSLIASVVTGQVDVRNIQVEDFDPADLISETDDDPSEDDDQLQEESEE